MSAAGHDARWDDELAAYLLDALDDAERDVFEAHLAGCEHCRAELRWLAPAVDVLPASVEQVEPPPALRGRVLAAVRAEGGADASGADPSGARRASLRDRLRRSSPALAGAAAALALAVGLAGGYVLRGDSDAGSGAAPTVVTVPLQPTEPTVRAAANVVRHDDTWTLDVSEIPDPRPGDVYQVWMRKGDRLLPSVLFVPSHDGSAHVVLPADTGTADEMLVTREPSGGSPEPTSPPLVSATM